MKTLVGLIEELGIVKITDDRCSAKYHFVEAGMHYFAHSLRNADGDAVAVVRVDPRTGEAAAASVFGGDRGHMIISHRGIYTGKEFPIDIDRFSKAQKSFINDPSAAQLLTEAAVLLLLRTP